MTAFSNINRFFCVSVLSGLLLIFGCGQARRQQVPAQVQPTGTIGSLAELYEFGAIPVKGWGIVAGLAGTGSSECPPALREVLVKYIQQAVSGDRDLDADEFINSPDTAVVEIRGVIPPVASQGDRFDVEVIAFTGTQTMSLDGGRLYPAQLKAVSRLQRFDQYSRTLATAGGAVFIDKLDSGAAAKTRGYVLGGGLVAEDVQISLILREPDYLVASAIRNRLNGRFGPGTARAVSPGDIRLSVPGKFKDDKDRFLAMVTALSVGEDEHLQQGRIEMLAGKLSRGEDVADSQVGLATIGKAALKELLPLLEAPDEKVRFNAAVCMLRIGDDRALPVLREIISDAGSAYRIGAIQAVGTSAGRNDAIAILSSVLADDNFEARFAAYEQLRNLGDISVSQTPVAGDFLVDKVVCGGEKVIYVSRSGQGRIVLFGSPIYCKDNIFIESADNNIVVNSGSGDKFVSVMRRHPKSPRLFGPLRSSFKLSDIIFTLGQLLPGEDKVLIRPGLGVAYSDILALLKQMAENGAVDAEFRAGPMPELRTIVEKTITNDR